MPWKDLNASKPVGTIGRGTPISKWAQGTILEGILVDRREGKFGPIFEFNDEKLGTVVYPVPTRLGFLLEKAAVGDRLRIECLGKVSGFGPNPIWDFKGMRDE